MHGFFTEYLHGRLEQLRAGQLSSAASPVDAAHGL
jgi:hypothetical protein